MFSSKAFQSCSGSSNGGTKLFGHLLCMLGRGDWRQARGARKMGVTVTAVTVIIQVSLIELCGESSLRLVGEMRTQRSSYFVSSNRFQLAKLPAPHPMLSHPGAPASDTNRMQRRTWSMLVPQGSGLPCYFNPGVSRNVQLCMLLDAHTLWQMHRRYQLHLGFASVAAELLFCTVIISYSEGKESIAVQTFKEKHMPVRSETPDTCLMTAQAWS